MSASAIMTDDSPRAVAAALLGSGYAVAAADPMAAATGLLPAERAQMPAMTEPRRREFAAGRRAARAAMQALGMGTQAIPAHPDRSPVWPSGTVGAITHSGAHCLAAVASDRTARSLGIDIEARRELDADLIPEICTLAERAWLGSRPEGHRRALALLLFSAKEAAYKCQFPVSRTLFGFDGLEITPDLDTGQFEATFVRDLPGFAAGDRLHGRFAQGPDWVLAVTALPLREGDGR